MDRQLVFGITEALKKRMYSNEYSLAGLSYRRANYVSPQKYEYLGDWQPVTALTLLNGSNTVFVRGSVCFPDEIRSDDDYEDCLFLRFHNLAGTVYVDGEPYHGIDANRDRIPLRPEWAGQTKELLAEGYSIGNDYDLKNAPPICLADACFRRVDRKIEQFLYDVRLAFEWYESEMRSPQEDNTVIRKKINAAFEESIRNFDASLEGEAFRDAAIRASAILREKLAAIDDGDVRSHVSFVASTHIDIAWLWRLKDTVRKCSHSFSNMLRLMDVYPEFCFSGSQVKLLAYTKEYYPALFEQIKAAHKAGRWENVGPMWVESDCNVVSGESLVRQMLHGISFLDREFGCHPRVAWLPDTFGYQANLPQILKKSGVDYFYSYKLHWQAHEKFPYGDFRWKGVDGSEILCSVINNPMQGYNGFPTPAALRAVKAEFEQQGEVDEIIFPYGYGDGGGGPTREMIEYAKRLEDYPGLPRCEITTAQSFFDRLESHRADLPQWYGELYIQTHRGTLTTVSEVKKNNRRVEMLYQSLEKLAVMAEACGARPDWTLLYKGWEDALTLQFHDILPGSSIDAVYEDCRRMYSRIFKIADRFLESAGLLPQPDGSGQVRVVNTLSWDRDVLATVRCPADAVSGRYVSVTSGGAVLPSSMTIRDDTAEITFLAKNVKAMSFADCCIAFTEHPEAKRKTFVFEHNDGIVVENERCRAVIDGEGRITELLDLRAGRQVLSAPGNDIRVFLDGPRREAAWNIEKLYKTRETEIFTHSCVELVEESDLRAVVRVKKSGERSAIEQDIIFYHDKDRIDFRTRVNWQEKDKMMRVYFPTSMNAPSFTSEVGFGAYSRPTVGNTKLDKAKFEVVAHRWIDISEGNYGVAVLNDSKYGHDVQYNTIGMTLLRSTRFPAEYPDIGEHEFTYSLYPHAQSWANADVARAGIELNAEAYAVSVISRTDIADRLFGCDNENIVIDTVKRAENGEGVVVRMYETNGTSGQATLVCGRQILSASESDLVENRIGDAGLADNAIRFSFTPHEIKTFIVRF